MARILRDSGNGYTDDRMELMAPKKNTDVHLEAMEITWNKGKESDEARDARVASLPKRKHSQRLLGYCRKWYFTTYHNK